MIQIKKFTPQVHKLKALIYGRPKVGKTKFAGTAPRPLFICAEQGLLSIADKSPDYVEVKTLQELKDLYTYLVKEKPDYDTIVIDSLSEISKIIKDNITKGGEKKMVMADRGTYGEEMMQVVRKIINLDYHVICIIHSKETVDESGVVSFYDIAISGQAKDEIPRYFDVIGFAYIDKDGHYKISVEGSSKTICGDRSNAIPKVDTPCNVSEWIDSIKSINTGGEQKTVATIDSIDHRTELEILIDESGTNDIVSNVEKTYAKLLVTIDSELSITAGTIKGQIDKSTMFTDAQKQSFYKFIDLYITSRLG